MNWEGRYSNQRWHYQRPHFFSSTIKIPATDPYAVFLVLDTGIQGVLEVGNLGSGFRLHADAVSFIFLFPSRRLSMELFILSIGASISSFLETQSE